MTGDCMRFGLGSFASRIAAHCRGSTRFGTQAKPPPKPPNPARHPRALTATRPPRPPPFPLCKALGFEPVVPPSTISPQATITHHIPHTPTNRPRSNEPGDPRLCRHRPTAPPPHFSSTPPSNEQLSSDANPQNQPQQGTLETSAFAATVAGVPVVLLRPSPASGSGLFRGGRIYGGGYNETEAYLYFCRWGGVKAV